VQQTLQAAQHPLSLEIPVYHSKDGDDLPLGNLVPAEAGGAGAGW
jgi:hypothetical protein